MDAHWIPHSADTSKKDALGRVDLDTDVDLVSGFNILQPANKDGLKYSKVKRKVMHFDGFCKQQTHQPCGRWFKGEKTLLNTSFCQRHLHHLGPPQKAIPGQACLLSPRCSTLFGGVKNTKLPL